MIKIIIGMIVLVLAGAATWYLTAAAGTWAFWVIMLFFWLPVGRGFWKVFRQ